MNNTNCINCIAITFYHFFYMGGGEKFINNFIKNYKKPFVIYVSSKFEFITYYPEINNKCVIYNNFDELDNYLDKHDIILDNQLYWEYEPEIKIILNKHKNKIISIIHSVDIYNKSLNSLFSINLFLPQNIHNSWNSHIKFKIKLEYDSIYTNINYIKEYKKDNNVINIGIIGRFDSYKIPLDFIDELCNFCKSNSNNFNFYFIGNTPETYIKYFEIVKLCCKKYLNINFIGFIKPDCLSDYLIKNIDIVIHPSINECGSYTMIEVQKIGIPIICRNTESLELLQFNKNLIFNTEKEIFRILNDINIDNIINLQTNMLFEINKNHNNYYNLINNYIDIPEYIVNCEKNNKIPNIIHFTFGFQKQLTEFNFVYFMSIYSAYILNNPKCIFFHYFYEPYGYWWDKIKIILVLNKITDIDNIYIGEKKVLKYAHKSDKIRMDMLFKYGGIYLDIDTISIKPLSIIKKYYEYDFVIGIESKNLLYKKSDIDNISSNIKFDKFNSLSNAIMCSKKGSKFLNIWINNYEKYFNPELWSEASIILPGLIYYNIIDSELIDKQLKDNILICEPELFYRPLYTNIDDIFEKNLNIDNNLVILHLWNTFSQKYLDNIDIDFIFNSSSLYAKICLKFYLENIENKFLYFNDVLNNNKILFLTNKIDKNIVYQKHSVSIFLYIKINNYIDIANSIISILNQNSILNYNIEIIIIDFDNNIFDYLLSNILLMDLSKKRLIKYIIISVNTNLTIFDDIFYLSMYLSSSTLFCGLTTNVIMYPYRLNYQINKLINSDYDNNILINSDYDNNIIFDGLLMKKYNFTSLSINTIHDSELKPYYDNKEINLKLNNLPYDILKKNYKIDLNFLSKTIISVKRI